MGNPEDSQTKLAIDGGGSTYANANDDTKNKSDILFKSALNLHQQGRIQEAEILYRELIEIQPFHSNALCNLGLLCNTTGRLKDAITFYEKSTSFLTE